jgi:hypothetical protein
MLLYRHLSHFDQLCQVFNHRTELLGALLLRLLSQVKLFSKQVLELVDGSVN